MHDTIYLTFICKMNLTDSINISFVLFHFMVCATLRRWFPIYRSIFPFKSTKKKIYLFLCVLSNGWKNEDDTFTIYTDLICFFFFFSLHHHFLVVSEVGVMFLYKLSLFILCVRIRKWFELKRTVYDVCMGGKNIKKIRENTLKFNCLCLYWKLSTTTRY